MVGTGACPKCINGAPTYAVPNDRFATSCTTKEWSNSPVAFFMIDLANACNNKASDPDLGQMAK